MLPPHIRWCIGRDYREILAIDRLSYRRPLTRKRLDESVRLDQHMITLVAEVHETVLGYIQYQLGHGTLHIDRLAVLPCARRQRVGWHLVNRVQRKLQATNRREITALVPESWLPQQLFLRACGFRWRRTFRPWEGDDGGTECVYEFAYYDGSLEGIHVIRRILAGDARAVAW